jgi:hypothetical protein
VPVRSDTVSWLDQREAARQLGVAYQSLWRARKAGRIPERYYVQRPRQGHGGHRDCFYDVEAMKADLRCRHPGCTAVVLGAGDFCKPHVVKEGAPVVAKQALRDQARERWRAEGLLTTLEVADKLGVSRASVGATAVPAGLHVARTEVLAGASYNLYTEPLVVDFRKEWARGGDGRRRAWWRNPDHARLVLRGRRDLKGPSIRDAEERAHKRRAVLTNLLRPGRPRRSQSERWKELYEDMFGGRYERHAAELGERALKPWERCLEVAMLEWDENPQGWDYEPARLPDAAAGKVYRALKRQGAL